MTKLIGIYAPYPLSGKGEVLKVFQEHGYQEITFARVVKETMMAFLIGLGVPEDIAYWHLYEEGKEEVIDILGITGGQLLSTFATKFVRNTINENIWLWRGLDDITEYLEDNPEPTGFISQDLRFFNEYEKCDITIRLVRKGVDSHTRAEESEGNLEDVPHTYYVENNGTLEELHDKIEDIIKEIG